MKKTRLNQIGFGVPMTRAQRRLSRRLRDPNEHPGGNNTGGESSQSGGSGEDGNNNGQTDPLESFWNDPEAPEKKVPAKDSATDDSGASGDGSLGTALKSTLEGMKFDGLMNDKILGEMGEGNFDSFNQNLTSALQKSVQTSMEMNIQVLQAFGTKMLQQVEEKISGKMTAKDQDDYLTQEIPSAKDPKIAPVAKMLYAQALRINGGKKVEAVATVKQMLTVMTQGVSKDIGIDFSTGADSGGEKRAPMNWVDELMASKT